MVAGAQGGARSTLLVLACGHRSEAGLMTAMDGAKDLDGAELATMAGTEVVAAFSPLRVPCGGEEHLQVGHMLVQARLS